MQFELKTLAAGMLELILIVLVHAASLQIVFSDVGLMLAQVSLLTYWVQLYVPS